MALYNWKDEYDVGVKRFDDHHKKLFDICNSLHDAMKAGTGEEALQRILNELVDYAAYHLAEEEKAMERIGYSDIINHKRAHKMFVDKLTDAMKEVESGQAIFVVSKISRTVVDWLVNHIRVVDKRYHDEMIAGGVR
ncbi:MAG: bacteriohemerythrin [Thermodesulfobacteriota bacterium]